MTREEAIQELKEDKMLYETDLCHAGDGTPDGRLLEAIDMAIEALQAEYEDYEHATLVDIKEPLKVSVVRCKDCRWYENRYGEVCHNPRYGDGHANYSPPYVDGEYFCKDGERRENDDY